MSEHGGGGGGGAGLEIGGPSVGSSAVGESKKSKGPKGPRLKPLRLTHSLSITHNSTKMSDYLILGGAEATNEDALLELLGVTHILNATTECANNFPDKFRYLRIPVKDEPSSKMEPYFEEAHKFIEEARSDGKCVLVHCQTGMSRSTTLVLAHFLLKGGMTLKEAFEYVKGRRPRAAPNSAFMQQLVALETKLLGKATIDVGLYEKRRFEDVKTFAIGTAYTTPVATPGALETSEAAPVAPVAPTPKGGKAPKMMF